MTAFLSWQSRASLFGAYSASVIVPNVDNTYDSDYLWEAIKIELSSDYTAIDNDGSSGAGCSEFDCFADSDIVWVYGLVSDVSSEEGMSEKAARLSVTSFFARSKKKVINTEEFDTNVSTVLTTLAATFCTIPSALYDFTNVETRYIKVPVYGNSLVDEMRKIAEVGRSYLFVGNDGVLKTDYWKDTDDSVEVNIPDEAIESVSSVHGESIGPSVIIVRGSFISDAILGIQDLIDGRTGSDQQRGAFRTTVYVGENVEYFDVKVTGLKGREEDIWNADVIVEALDVSTWQNAASSDSDAEESSSGWDVTNSTGTGYILSVEKGGASCVVRIYPGNWIDRGQKVDIVIYLRARIRKHDEYDSPSSRRKALAGRLQEAGDISKSIGQVMGVGGRISRSPELDNDKLGDEPELTRIETVVEDSDLMSEYGVQIDQVDNLYVTSLEDLFYMGIRRFQEFKMARHQYQVKTRYLACLEVNQVVSFTTPDVREAGSSSDEESRITVTGVITELSVSYDTIPNCTMDLTIASFEEIGSTSYSSGNLFLDPTITGVGKDGVEESPWVTNDLNYGYASDNYLNLDADEKGDTVWIAQDVYTEVDAEYTVTFKSNEIVVGGATVEATGVASQGCAGTGSEETYTFTATAVTTRVKWEATTGHWQIWDVSLVKTVTK